MRQILAQVHNRLSLGKRGENDAVQVLFPVIDGLTGALIVEREGDSQPYPVVTNVTDGYIVWTVNSYDTNVVGNVRAEVDYTDEAGTVVKSVTYLFRVSDSLSEPSEDVPDPYEDWYEKVLQAKADAETAAESVSKVDASVSKSGTVATITMTSRTGETTTATVSDGEKGDKGDTGAQGPQGEKGDTGPQGEKGSDADVTADNIKSALGYTPANDTDIGELKEDLADKQDKLTDADKQAIADLHTDKVTDVQINGSSAVVDGVANVPIASTDAFGVGKVSTTYGTSVNSNGVLSVAAAVNGTIDARTNAYRPIVPNTLDYAVKAAMCDGKGAEWTATEQAAARTRMGISDEWSVASTEITESGSKSMSVTISQDAREFLICPYVKRSKAISENEYIAYGSTSIEYVPLGTSYENSRQRVHTNIINSGNLTYSFTNGAMSSSTSDISDAACGATMNFYSTKINAFATEIKVYLATSELQVGSALTVFYR